MTTALRLAIASGMIFLSAAGAMADAKLTGTPLGSTGDGHTWADAFDGNTSTYFKAGGGQFKYVGLDLATPHIINSIRFTPQSGQEAAMTLGIFEGANRADFMDAVPIQMIKSTPKAGENYLTVQCSRGFRYVRYVGPDNKNCRVAEIEFYGVAGAGDDQHLYQISALPTMIINVQKNGQAIVPPSKQEDDAEGVHYTIINDNRIDTDEALKTDKKTGAEAYPGSIRIRGNASANWEKKPWKVKFGDKQNPLGLNPDGKANKKWALLSNHGDKTLMRNIVAFDIARKISKVWVPGIAAVDVVLNGEYQGCYQLAEAENVQKGRVDIEEFNIDAFEGTDKNGIHYDNITDAFAAGGFMIEADGYAHQSGDGNYFDTDPYGVGYSFESPDPADFTNADKKKQMVDYVKGVINELENLAKEENSYDRLREKMHVDDLLRYLMINDLCANPDALWSVKMFREGTNVTDKKGNVKDSRVHIGPVWDFDLGFANDEYTSNPTGHNGFMWDWDATSAADKDALYYNGGWQWSDDKTAMRYFVHDIFFKNESKMKELSRAIYEEAVANGLTVENINALVESLAAQMDESQELNFKRWPVLNQKIHREPNLYGSFREYVDHLKDFISKELPHFEGLIGYNTATENQGVEITGEVKKNENDKKGWSYEYDIPAAKFADVAKGGTLRITLKHEGSGSHQSAIFFIPNPDDSSYDHNAHESDHLMTDRHDGQWSYSDISDPWTGEAKLTADQVAKLKERGLRITCNHGAFVKCVYIAPSEVTEDPEAPAATDLSFTDNGETGWDHRYTVSADEFAAKNIKAGGTLYMRMTSSGNGQWNDHYDVKDEGYNHNQYGDHHIFTDPSKGGNWYENLNGTREVTKILTEDHVTNLMTLGHCWEANGTTLEAVKYTAPVEVPDPDKGDTWLIYDSWQRNMDEGVVFIPASFFKGFTTAYSLAIYRTLPESQPAAVAPREDRTPLVSLYHLDSSSQPAYLTTGGQEIKDAPFNTKDEEKKILEAYTLEYLTASDVQKLKNEGLYVGGKNFTLYNVWALKPGNSPTGVDSVKAGDAPEAYYTLQGIRVERMQPGEIYIVVKAGKSRKVMAR